MKKGFTLVELMITVAILGLIASVAVPMIIKDNQPASNKINIPDSSLSFGENHSVTETTWDGCQYIFVNMGNASWGTHKGNCNNPIHQYKIEK